VQHAVGEAAERHRHHGAEPARSKHHHARVDLSRDVTHEWRRLVLELSRAGLSNQACLAGELRATLSDLIGGLLSGGVELAQLVGERAGEARRRIAVGGGGLEGSPDVQHDGTDARKKPCRLADGVFGLLAVVETDQQRLLWVGHCPQPKPATRLAAGTLVHVTVRSGDWPVGPSDLDPALSLHALDETRLRRLVDVGPTLGAELELDSVLDKLLIVAREVTGARYAAVGVLGPRRDHLERFVTQGVNEEARRQIGELPHGHGVLGVLIRDPRPLRLHDVSEHPLSYGFPPGHPPMGNFLGVPVRIGGEAWGNLYLTEKEGGDFDEGDEQAACVLARWAGLAIEHARFHEQTRTQRDELAFAMRALEATTLISRALGTEVELEPTLELVVKRGRALVDARSMLILLRDGERLVITAMAGEASTDLRGVALPLQGSASGKAFLSGEVHNVPDFAEQITMTARRAGLGVSPEQFVTPGKHPALFVPMLFRGRAVGVLNAIGRVRGADPFSDAEKELIKSFAGSAATAVATAQTVEADRLSRSLHAMEDERTRWARELHDETLQGLGALRVLLSSASRTKDADQRERALQQAIEQVTAEIGSLRALITDLRPAALDEIGLGPALDALIEQRRRQTGLDIRSRVELEFEAGTAPRRLTPELETAAYRLVQEALTNVAKHAQARRVSVAVSDADGRVLLTVEDDGIGFDGANTDGGFGLTGMRERAALAGGELTVTGEHGQGTRVEAWFPLVRVGDAAPLRVLSDSAGAPASG
jgi:two-component system, NarL family, sensor histidine kinase DevS